MKNIKKEEDFEDFIENILDKNNSAHMRAYEGIKNILLGNKNTNKSSNKTSSQKADNSSHNRPTQQHKKGKTKFKDINTYQAKKKEKDGE